MPGTIACFSALFFALFLCYSSYLRQFYFNCFKLALLTAITQFGALGNRSRVSTYVMGCWYWLGCLVVKDSSCLKSSKIDLQMHTR